MKMQDFANAMNEATNIYAGKFIAIATFGENILVQLADEDFHNLDLPISEVRQCSSPNDCIVSKAKGKVEFFLYHEGPYEAKGVA